MAEPVVGVLGGMGPEATVDLMRRVITATPAEDDGDHIHMIVDNNPKVPSRIKALIEGTGENPGPALARMARRLEAAGTDFLVIPCNTAHHYWHYAADAVSIPVWNLVELTLGAIAAGFGPQARVGMLVSPAVRDTRLYERHAGGYGMEFMYPREQQRVLNLIKAVKAGRAGADQLAVFQATAQALGNAGAEVLVLACTELSIIADRVALDIPVLDTLQVLAEGIVAAVKGGAGSQGESCRWPKRILPAGTTRPRPTLLHWTPDAHNPECQATLNAKQPP
jgi:aspartate racemase